MTHCGVLSSFVVASAMLSANATAGTADIIASNNQFGAQYISTYVDYTENGNGMFGSRTGVLDTEKGRVPGFALSASAMWGEDNSYVRAEFSRNRGQTYYVGAPLGGGPYGSAAGTSTATLWDGSMRLGTGYSMSGDAMATLYAELGARQWDRGVNFGETFKHAYYGLGLMGQYSPAGRLVFSANALIGHTFGSHISVAGPLGFSAALGNSYLYKAGFGVDLALTRHFHLTGGVDYTSFKYGVSSVQTVTNPAGTFFVWEPDSSTKYITARVGLGYSF